jgi:hypothetical protein
VSGLSWNLPGGTEENEKTLDQDNHCPGQDSNRTSVGNESGALPLRQPARYAVTSISFFEYGYSLGTDISQWSTVVFFHPFQWLVYFNRCIKMIRVHLPCKCAVSSHVKCFNLKLHKTIYLQLADLQIFHLCLEVINLDLFRLSPRPHSLGHTRPSVQFVAASEQGGRFLTSIKCRG